MLIIKQFVTYLTLLSFIAVQPSIAYGQEISLQSKSGDYSLVKEGEKAPYTGYLFDPEGLIKIITNKNLELQQLKIEKDSEIKSINIQLESQKKQYELELRVNKELNDNVVKLKDDKIKELEDSKKYDDIKLIGALTLGMALSVTIFFAAVKITKI